MVSVPFAAVGCGGDDNTSQTAQRTIDSTFSQPHDYKSGRLDATLSVSGGSDSGAAAGSIKLQGPWQSTGRGGVPKFSVDVDLGTGGRTIRVRVISDGKGAWVDFSGLTYKLPDSVFKAFQSAWAGQGSGSGGNLLTRLGFDPSGWISSPEVVGDEKLGGVDVTHVKAKVNVAKVADDLGSVLSAASSAGSGLIPIPQITDKVREQLSGAVDQADFNLWTGKSDGAIRRVSVSIHTKQTGPLPPLSINFDVNLSSLNEPQTIEIPTNAGGLGGLAGILAGVAGLGSGGEGSGGGTYADCVAKAKTADAVAACTAQLIK
jgi:hypothetical protein